MGSNPLSVAVGDLNADGFSDLAVANFNSSNVSVLLGDGKGSFGTAINFNAGNATSYVIFGDFNKDNRPALATTNAYSRDVSILLNTTVNAGIGGDSNATLTGSNSMIFGSNGDDILMGGRSSDIIIASAGSNQSFL